MNEQWNFGVGVEVVHAAAIGNGEHAFLLRWANGVQGVQAHTAEGITEWTKADAQAALGSMAAEDDASLQTLIDMWPEGLA